MRLSRLLLLALAFCLLLLGPAAPASADYLGPSRSRTVYSDVTYTADEWLIVRWSNNLIVCNYFLNIPPEAQNPPLGSCTPEDFAVLEATPPCVGDPRFCVGYYTQPLGPYMWMEVIGVTVTDPPATVSATLQGCQLQNDWCVGAASLTVSGSEPVAGYQITAIEGTRNGLAFYCPAASCDLPLVQGENDFTFWALSTYGDSSEMGTFSARMDTLSPVITATLSGTAGDAGWWVSDVQVDLDAQDPAPGSGLVVFEHALDGGAWSPAPASLILGNGEHALSLRAADAAGLTSEESLTVRVDTLPPQVEGRWLGTPGLNGWFVSPVLLEVTAQDPAPGSGLARVDYSLFGGAWTPLPGGGLSFGDGEHAVDLRAVDAAGNESAFFPVPLARVDATPPSLLAPEAWSLGEAATIVATDAGSGLEWLSLSIVDPSGAHPARTYAWSGSSLSVNFVWDRRWGDGVLAAEGSYPVRIEAADRAGNRTWRAAQILVATGAPASVTTVAPSEPAAGAEPAGQTPPPSSPTPTRVPPPTSTPRPVVVATVGAGLPEGREDGPEAGGIPSSVLWGAAALAAAAALTAGLLRIQAARAAREEQQRQQAEDAARGFNAVQDALRRLIASLPGTPRPPAPPPASGSATPPGKVPRASMVSDVKLSQPVSSGGSSSSGGLPSQAHATQRAGAGLEGDAGAAQKPAGMSKQPGKMLKRTTALVAVGTAALLGVMSVVENVLPSWKGVSVPATQTFSAVSTKVAITLAPTMTALAWTPTPSRTPTPTVTPTPTMTPTPIPHFYMFAQRGVNLRTQPSLSDEVLVGQLPCGQLVGFVEGISVAADGYQWWKIYAPGTGMDGLWAASELFGPSSPGPDCKLTRISHTAYPDAGRTMSFTSLPIMPDVHMDFWWGFGNTIFARANRCVWYKNTSGLHPGVDFGVAYNTPLYWTADQPGIVTGHTRDPKSDNFGAGPNYLIIQVGDYKVLFGHLSDIELGWQVNDVVQPGQLIGYVGNPDGIPEAGNNHLHLEVRLASSPNIAINPLDFFAPDLQREWEGKFAEDYLLPGETPHSIGYYVLRSISGDECNY